jgi:hypothetical protein
VTVPVVRVAEGLHPVGELPRTSMSEVRLLNLPGALGP